MCFATPVGLYLVLFFDYIFEINFYYMSRDLRNEDDGDGGIRRLGNEGRYAQASDGFEGMNFEQVRQPYHFNPEDRNSSIGEPNEGNDPMKVNP